MGVATQEKKSPGRGDILVIDAESYSQKILLQHHHKKKKTAKSSCLFTNVFILLDS